jgi:hypothetical protein
MLVKDVIEEYQRYKSGFIWCLGCKLSMHLKTILYCLEKRIKYAADGSSKDTSEFVEQMPISLSSIKMIYKKYGINYLTPVYNKKRIEKIELLKKNNLRLGIPIGIGNRFLGIQPRCIPGELYYLPGVLLNRFPVHCEKDVYRFINSKLDLIDKIINDIFR